MNDFPLILAGPIVRRCEPSTVCVWLALRSPCTVKLQVFDAPPGESSQPIVQGERQTVRLGEHLHVVSVTATSTEAPLEWGRRYWYGLGVRINDVWRDLYDEGVLRHGIADASALDRLVYEGEELPSFRLPPPELEGVRIAHGSCRKPHGPGPDGLATLDAELERAFAGGTPERAPQQLFLTGDQIYADDVDPSLLRALIAAGEEIIGPDREKQLELAELADSLQPGNREPLVKEHGQLTSSKAACHLVTLSEFYMMYLFSWSDIVCQDAQLDSPVRQFRAAAKHVRRALANISTYMIFDDHEITDDWYRTRHWVRTVTETELGSRVIRNGLTAYALFQHWGNDPAAFVDGTPGRSFLGAADDWDGTASGAGRIREHIYIPAGADTLEPIPSVAIDWHYSLDTPAYRVVALDTRTRRTYASDSANPGLMSHAAMDVALPDAATRPVTIVLSATPVLGVKLIELMQSSVGRLADSVRGSTPSGSDAFDVEAWAFDEHTYRELLQRLSRLGRVLVLSGDVHYGFGATLRAKDRDFRLVNFVSSALCNEVFSETASSFLNAFAASLRDLEAVGEPGIPEASPEDLEGEREAEGFFFDEEVLPDTDDIESVVALESAAGFPVSMRLRGILGSANLGEVSFQGEKVVQRLLWWSRGERQVKRYEATLDVSLEGTGLEATAGALPKAATGTRLDLESATDRLQDALQSDDPTELTEAFAASSDAIRDESSSAMVEDLGIRTLGLLRSHQKFEEIIEIASVLSEREVAGPRVLRYEAQALIDTGQVPRAIEVLGAADTDIEKRLAALDESSLPTAAYERILLREEQAEVQGLLGRSYKQRYIDAEPSQDNPQTELAWRAAKYYGDCYRSAPTKHLWHGINYVAVRSHQNRVLTGGAGPQDLEASEVAQQILRTLDVLEERGMLTMWDLATRAEALLALGRSDAASVALDRYLSHADLNAFARASTRRQWTELWQLDTGSDLERALLAKLGGDEKAASRTGVTASAETSQAAPEPPAGVQLEGRFEDPRFSGGSADALGRDRARGVARLGRDLYSGTGSGFLFDGSWIWPEYAGPPLLLTNAHVCSALAEELEAFPPAVDPRDIRVLFLDRIDSRRANVIVEYVEALWSSPRTELDATILMLRSAPWGVTSYPIASTGACEGQKAQIIGYPLGGAKWYSVEDNRVEQTTDKYFYYTSATEPGNSGSPVFNDNWQLVGLHRAGDQAQRLNYGVHIDKILNKAKKDLLARYGPKGPSQFR